MNSSKTLCELSRSVSKHAMLPLLAVAIVACLITACSGGGADAKKKGQGPKGPTPVLAATAATATVPVQVSAIGTVEPFVTVSIKAQVGGTLTKVNFQEGQDVKEGDLLFVIDPRPYESALRSAQADMAKAVAQSVQAGKTNTRYTELLKDKVVSNEEYEQAHANAESLAASVSAAQAAVEKAKLDLAYCTIYSPVTGRTGNLMVDQGNLIKANDVPMVTINQIMPIRISFALPEENLDRVKRYMAEGSLGLQAILPNAEDRPISGSLTFLDNSVDRATGTIRLKGTFPNTDHRLWPGQFAQVHMVLTTIPNAVTVPNEAIQTGQSGQYVYVIKPDQSVELRTVTTGESTGNSIVVRTGLKAGEQVVTDGQMRLTTGAKVAIRKGLSSDANTVTAMGGPGSGGAALDPPAKGESKTKSRETPVN